MSDPAKYRTREEVEKFRTGHDALELLRAKLVEGGFADDDKLKALDKEVREVVADAAEFAQASPEPDPAELWTDILVEA